MTVASNVVPFNPLERKHLGASVAQAMLAQTPQPLAALPRFEGAGIYAIYYTGPLACYAALSAANRGEKFTLPIYVGKAVPEGARIGGGMGAAGFDLHKRLREHAKSVAQAENLDAADFFCRYLVVEDIWIPLGESLLIAKFAPIWNTTVTGFGNHNPGSGRKAGAKPRWDQLHPGRPWALGLAAQPVSAEEIAREAESYLRDFTIPTSQLVELEPRMAVPPAVMFSNDETNI